jgi:phage shock protein PspC (stress-responsive transcriptional regulator)
MIKQGKNEIIGGVISGIREQYSNNRNIDFLSRSIIILSLFFMTKEIFLATCLIYLCLWIIIPKKN